MNNLQNLNRPIIQYFLIALSLSIKSVDHQNIYRQTVQFHGLIEKRERKKPPKVAKDRLELTRAVSGSVTVMTY